MKGPLGIDGLRTDAAGGMAAGMRIALARFDFHRALEQISAIADGLDPSAPAEVREPWRLAVLHGQRASRALGRLDDLIIDRLRRRKRKRGHK